MEQLLSLRKKVNVAWSQSTLFRCEIFPAATVILPRAPLLSGCPIRRVCGWGLYARLATSITRSVCVDSFCFPVAFGYSLIFMCGWPKPSIPRKLLSGCPVPRVCGVGFFPAATVIFPRAPLLSGCPIRRVCGWGFYARLADIVHTQCLRGLIFPGCAFFRPILQ
jgi:hypothetical protein